MYCPLDAADLQHTETSATDGYRAFHRALYVFICRKASCLKTACIAATDGTSEGSTTVNGTGTGTGVVRCLRCQLPKINPYFPITPKAFAGQQRNLNQSNDKEASVISRSRWLEGRIANMPPRCALCG